MVRQFALKNPPLAILRERENIFKLLSGTTNDSLQKNYKDFTIDPKTRYKGFDTKRVSNMTSLKGLYDTDDRENADYTIASPSNDAMIHKPIRKRTSSGKNNFYIIFIFCIKTLYTLHITCCSMALAGRTLK